MSTDRKGVERNGEKEDMICVGFGRFLNLEECEL